MQEHVVLLNVFVVAHSAFPNLGSILSGTGHSWVWLKQRHARFANHM